MQQKRNICYYVGSNFNGQIGNGVETDSIFGNSIRQKKELTAINTLPDVAIIDIKTGRDNVYYLLANGQCFVAGNNDRRQLLTNNETMRKICCHWSKNQLVPWDVCYLIILFINTNEKIKCVSLLSPICIHNHVKSISNGVVSDHRFIIDQSNDSLYGVGTNHSDQFNIGDINSNDAEKDIDTLNFVEIVYFKKNAIELKQIHCSMGYSMFLAQNGTLYVCGTSTGGGLGLDGFTESYGIKLVTNAIKVMDVSCGCDHTLLLTTSHRLYSCGWNGNGQLGLGHSDNAYKPQLIKSLENNDIVMIASGYQHNLVLDKKGKIYSFGDNYYNQCGVNEEITRVPVGIRTLNDDESVMITDMKCGGYHNVICSNSKDYYLWGDNQYNQCLVEEEGIVPQPMKYTDYKQYIGSDYKIIAIYPGQGETRIVTQCTDL